MPAFIAAFIGGLIPMAGSIVGRVLIALGVGYVSYTGISTALNAIKTQVFATLTALPSGTVQLLGLLKVDVCLSILFSAIAARLVLNGLTSDAIKRWVLK